MTSLADMTNEELVKKIKTGEKIYTADLWSRIQAFVRSRAYIYYSKCRSRFQSVGVTEEDLYQSGYFAMLRALKNFEPGAGAKFLTYFSWYLRHEFQIQGAMTSARGQNDPGYTAKSLDESLINDEDYSLLARTPDESAENAFLLVDHADYYAKLQSDLEKAISTLSERQQEIIQERYYNNRTLQNLADKLKFNARAYQNNRARCFDCSAKTQAHSAISRGYHFQACLSRIVFRLEKLRPQLDRKNDYCS